VRRPADRATRDNGRSCFIRRARQASRPTPSPAGPRVGELGTQLPACPRGGARARAGSGGSATYKILKYKKIILKNPEDNKFIPMIG
jgi:hypothetical protein